MYKEQVVQKIKELGILAVIRGNSSEEAVALSEACIRGGVTGIELAFTTPHADEAIRALAGKYEKDGDVLIGAGTVLDAETARLAILAGAEFVVSPSLDISSIRLCNRYRVACMPGVTTVQGVIEALEQGVDIVKVFPGDVVGMNFIKSVRGPLPQAQLMPTGGVSIDNVKDWLKAGCVAVGVGGALTGGGRTEQEITDLAKRFIQTIRDTREEK